MKQFYTWSIHDDYARYWTKESIEDSEEFGELYDKAELFLGIDFNPNNLEKWEPPLLKEKVDEYNYIRLKGDMHATWLGEDGYMFSQNMVDKIGDTLREYGQLFPLEVEDREDKLYRYWVTKEIPFEFVDKEKSKFFKNKYNENGTFKIERLVLKEEYYTDMIIFRIKGEDEKTIFVSDEFIELIKKHDLKGFNFIPNTSYEYASQNGSTILIG